MRARAVTNCAISAVNTSSARTKTLSSLAVEVWSASASRSLTVGLLWSTHLCGSVSTGVSVSRNRPSTKKPTLATIKGTTSTWGSLPSFTIEPSTMRWW